MLGGPALFRMRRRAAWNQKNIGLPTGPKSVAGNIAIGPGKVERRVILDADAGHGQLVHLALQRVFRGPVGGIVAVRAPPDDSRPLRPCERERRTHKAEIARRPVRCLEIVDALEPPAIEPAHQGDPVPQLMGLGTAVIPDIVEQAAPFGQGSEGGDGEKGDMNIAVVGTDRRHGAVAEDEITQGAQLDHQDAVHHLTPPRLLPRLRQIVSRNRPQGSWHTFVHSRTGHGSGG